MLFDQQQQTGEVVCRQEVVPEGIVCERGHTTGFVYDGLGRPVAQVDALGQGTTTVYDAVGNVVRTVDDRAIAEASRKGTMPIVGWKQALNHFAILFERRLPLNLCK